jgi:hypothetical protein
MKVSKRTVVAGLAAVPTGLVVGGQRLASAAEQEISQREASQLGLNSVPSNQTNPSSAPARPWSTPSKLPEHRSRTPITRRP